MRKINQAAAEATCLDLDLQPCVPFSAFVAAAAAFLQLKFVIVKAHP
jgi:hypothetical protein